MALQNKKEELEKQEKKAPVPEHYADFGAEKLVAPEKLKEDKLVSEELRKEIEMMELDDKTKSEAQKKAEKISFLGEKEKIERLLQIARQKGVVFAVQVAKKMNEPYLLDILHDTLANEGFYKDFMK